MFAAFPLEGISCKRIARARQLKVTFFITCIYFKILEVHVGCVILTKAKIGGVETGGYTLFCQDVQEMFQMYDSALVVRHLLPSLQQMFHPSYAFSVKKTIFVAI